ncbi:MAG: PilZ domain-containing protein [Phycisphaerales bacterium]|nr:PilZ domain-containing protein [Phycisphaerae bacterium]NNF42688.1 PilZ domain-containing protein [Phycisphaerales bacterium]NNM27524.1 PilZ domain-containing protein [Phycisphaerales bacterium]
MINGWRRDTSAFQDIQRQMGSEESVAADNHRRHGRLKPGVLWCNLGVLQDISASGLRVVCKRPVEGGLRVVLRGPDRVMRLNARVVWCRKLKFRKYEAGIQFDQVPDDVAAYLRSMALG